jgi:hypothetical protein
MLIDPPTQRDDTARNYGHVNVGRIELTRGDHALRHASQEDLIPVVGHVLDPRHDASEMLSPVLRVLGTLR